MPLTPAQRFRRAANLVNLSTPAGLLLARIGGCRRSPGPMGLWLAEDYRFRFPIASAFTVGDVVLTSGRFTELSVRLPRLLEHEERHSRQYVWCGGLPYLLLYSAAMGWSWLRTRDRARANWFEVDAGLVAGGYLPPASGSS